MSFRFKDDGNIPEEILSFIDKNKEKEISIDEYVESHSNLEHIHNHTLENLFLYFHLERHLEKNRVVFYKGAVFIVDNRRHKFFISDTPNLLEELDFSSLVDLKIRKKFTFYSSHGEKIEGLTVGKSKESVYNLPYVFSEESFFEKYPNLLRGKIKKKIYNRLKYPFSYLEKHNFKSVDITEENLEVALNIHKQWVDFKVNNPDVFQMLFSSNRYNKALEKMFLGKGLLDRKNFYAKIFYFDGEPIAVRQVLLKGKYSYDIGFFSTYFNLPSNVVNYISTYSLNELRELGIKFHNTGMKFDKKNNISKSHFPSEDKIIYSYKLKND